jgi:hypothetical protein
VCSKSAALFKAAVGLAPDDLSRTTLDTFIVLYENLEAMNDPIEILNGIRQKKLDFISRGEGEIRNWEEEIRQAKYELSGIEEAISAIKGKAPPESLANGDTPLIGKYANVKLTPAVEDVIKIHGAMPGLLVPEIIARLLAEGFKGDSKKLYTSVYPVAQRLVLKEKVKEGVKNGKRSFIRK